MYAGLTCERNVLPNLSGAVILARHGEATNGELDHVAREKARLVGAELVRLNIDTDHITTSEVQRAYQTGQAQNTGHTVVTNELLNEVKYPRQLIIPQLYIGKVPEKHREAGRKVLKAIVKEEIVGYNVTHNGVIAGVRATIEEFPELFLSIYTIDNNMPAPEQPNPYLKESLVMKNLAFVAIHKNF